MATSQSPQRIARLAPLADVLEWIDANARPVVPTDTDIASAIGRTLASDVGIPHPIPAQAISLRDGFAVQSDWTSDASAYAPAPLAVMPVRVEVGDPLPPGADCVAALDHIAIKGEHAEALAVIAPGEGILPIGGDIAVDQSFLNAGKRLRASDAALLRCAKVSKASIRAPRVSVVRAGHPGDTIIASAARIIEAAIVAGGGTATSGENSLESAFQKDTDAIVAIGGTGAGQNDTSVTALSRAGKVAFHGIGLHPGETAAIGGAGGKPVLLLPGRIDAALACWLVLGRRMLARLAGGTAENVTVQVKLSRKITSTIGIADVVLLKSRGRDAEPLASGHWPMQAMAQADCYLVVPAESEGFPAGVFVNASPLP